jgi:DNA-binding SARP family transcriptional activator
MINSALGAAAACGVTAQTVAVTALRAKGIFAIFGLITASTGGAKMAELEFSVLGPLEVRIKGRPVPIASARQRIVLATLLMAANHVLTVDTLIDAVWDGNPPSSARGQIQICISALRRLLEAPELIETSPNGYRIRVTGDQLDYNTFNAALDRGRSAAADGQLEPALEHLDAALRLWRGPALAGLPGRAAETFANRLDERRLMAIEDRIEYRLGLGAHRELVAELVTLTSEHPLRERLWGFRMTALYRSGRQAEALAAYRAARQVLVDELGLEPGANLRRLESAILSHDASLDGTAEREAPPAPPTAGPPPRQLPADIPDFVGRAELLETLVTVLTRTAEPASTPIPVALITGPAGCGKSAAAIHAAHLVRDHFPDGQLVASLHGSAANPTPMTEVLSAFLRALGVAPDAVPGHGEERIKLLRSHMAGRRLLIVLDDVADEQQISALLPGVPGPAVLMTSRNRGAAPPGAHVAELGIMSEPESRLLLERIAGPERIAASAAVAELTRICCGLPLALRISGMRLAARPHWSVATLVDRLADERHRLAELSYGELGVRPLLALAYAALSPRAQELCRLLSALEMPDFSPVIAAALLDSDLAEGERVLDELADARVLAATAVDGQSARYCFHDLTRIFAREIKAQHPPGQEAAAVDRVLGCLLAFADEAHRRLYGGDYTLLHGSSPRWGGAKPYFDRLVADPMAWFDAERPSMRAAVLQAADRGLDEFCWELAVVCVALYEAHGLFDEWRTTHGVALRAVTQAGNRRGEAVVLASLGSLGVGQHTQDDETMLVASLRLFEQLGDVLGQALALRTLAHLDRIQGRPGQAAERYERALKLLRIVDDKGAQAHILSGLARTYLDLRDLERAEVLSKESLLLGQQLDNRRLQAQALYRLGEVMVCGSQMLAAKALFQESLQIVRMLGDRVGEAYTLSGLGSAALDVGDTHAAEAYFAEALDISQAVHERNIQAHSLLGLGRALAARGDNSQARQYYARAASSFAVQENGPGRSRALDALGAMSQVPDRDLAHGTLRTWPD